MYEQSDWSINGQYSPLLYDTIQVQSILVPLRAHVAVPIYGIWHSNISPNQHPQFLINISLTRLVAVENRVLLQKI